MADYKGVLTKGTNHMVNDVGYEPQRTNNYEVQIVGLEGIVDMYGHTVSQSSNASEIITLSTASFEAPNITISPITVRYGNNSIKFAGVPEFPDSSIVLNDYIGVNTEKILSAWFSQAYNPVTEEIGYAVEYKKTAFLIEYDTKYSTGSTKYNYQSRVWKMEGCWLANLQLGSFSAEGGAQRQITATMVYDCVKPLDA